VKHVLLNTDFVSIDSFRQCSTANFVTRVWNYVRVGASDASEAFCLVLVSYCSRLLTVVSIPPTLESKSGATFLPVLNSGSPNFRLMFSYPF